MENFIEREFDNLMKIYIQERLNRHGEMGVLFLLQMEDKIDVRFIPSRIDGADSFWEDLGKLNTPSGSNMFICCDNKIMTYDLEKHKTKTKIFFNFNDFIAIVIFFLLIVVYLLLSGKKTFYPIN